MFPLPRPSHASNGRMPREPCQPHACPRREVGPCPGLDELLSRSSITLPFAIVSLPLSVWNLPVYTTHDILRSSVMILSAQRHTMIFACALGPCFCQAVLSFRLVCFSFPWFWAFFLVYCSFYVFLLFLFFCFCLFFCSLFFFFWLEHPDIATPHACMLVCFSAPVLITCTYVFSFLFFSFRFCFLENGAGNGCKIQQTADGREAGNRGKRYMLPRQTRRRGREEKNRVALCTGPEAARESPGPLRLRLPSGRTRCLWLLDSIIPRRV